jgi:hypothetical protein
LLAAQLPDLDDEAFVGVFKLLRELPESLPYVSFKVASSVMTSFGSKAPASARHALLLRAGFVVMQPAQRDRLITPSVLKHLTQRQTMNRAVADITDQWYAFAPPTDVAAAVGARPGQPSSSSFDSRVGSAMIAMALLRYGWREVDVSANRNAVRFSARDGKHFKFRVLALRDEDAETGGLRAVVVLSDVCEAVTTAYGAPRVRRAKGRQAKNGNAKRSQRGNYSMRP